jgi:hypothetical protein
MYRKVPYCCLQKREKKRSPTILHWAFLISRNELLLHQQRSKVDGLEVSENVINFVNRMGVLTFTNVQVVKWQCWNVMADTWKCALILSSPFSIYRAVLWCAVADYRSMSNKRWVMLELRKSYLCLRMLPVVFIICDNLAVFYAVKMSTRKYLIKRSTRFAHHICINLYANSQWHKRHFNSQYGLL